MLALLKRCKTYQLLSVSIGLLLIVLFFAHPFAGAAIDSSAISQGFQTTEKKLVAGALVSLQAGKPGTVELANTDRAQSLIGVVGKDSLIEFSNKDNTIQVVTTGVTNTLVSDLEGEVKTGDRIAPSPIDGIGMKVNQSTMIIGSAQADLTAVKTTEHFITDINGKVHTVHIGLIPVQVNVTYYAPTTDSAFVPGFLQDLANAVAGKQVSAIRVLIALIVMLVAFVSVAILLYASVKSSIISIGRNPLSEISVRKGLLQIGLTVVGILLFTLITIYLVLTT
jgi:hypothetical protein